MDEGEHNSGSADNSSVRSRWVIDARRRAFQIDLPEHALSKIHKGTMKGRYRGLALQKNPFDRVIYLELLQKLKPNTVVEIGSFQGGSAIWLRDQCRALGLPTQILSIDIKPPMLEADDVLFIEGDAMAPERTFPHDALANCSGPLLVISDSAHVYETEAAVLRYFADRIQVGDYIVVEDGIVADLADAKFRAFEDGPNRAVAQFLAERSDFQIDEDLCDFFGHNVTYCPNAWLYKSSR